MKKLIFASMLLGSALSVNASNEETCNEAASKINNIIEDWYSLVKEYGTEEKNPGVLAMYRDYKSGTLDVKLKKHCVVNWAKDSSMYECFSGVRSEIGAAMCMHPDTNKNGWSYQ